MTWDAAAPAANRSPFHTRRWLLYKPADQQEERPWPPSPSAAWSPSPARRASSAAGCVGRCSTRAIGCAPACATPTTTARIGFLKAMPGYASGRLTLHAADLDQRGCFDEIFAGCHGVAHVSHVSDYNDQDYVRRTCDHIIASVNGSGSVGRVVVTSCVAAVISEMDLQEIVRRPVFYEDRYPDETNPKRTPERGQGYSMGKLVAERAFAEAADAAAGAGTPSPAAQATTSGRSSPPTRRTWAPGSTNRDHARGRLTPERRLPPLDDRRRARRRRLPHRPAGEHRGEERRALHRLVDRRAQRRGHLRRHRPPAAGTER